MKIAVSSTVSKCLFGELLQYLRLVGEKYIVYINIFFSISGIANITSKEKKCLRKHSRHCLIIKVNFVVSLFLRFAQEVLYLTHLLALVTNYSLVIYFKSMETK